jgi:hypothetical protein
MCVCVCARASEYAYVLGQEAEDLTFLCVLCRFACLCVCVLVCVYLCVRICVHVCV